jgi:hypothetical protein
MEIQERIQKYSMPEPNTGCVLWVGACGSSGYPQLTVVMDSSKPKSIRIHKYVCEQAHGPSNGLNALHKCDVKCCINPDHLYFGTQKQNIQDAYSRNRVPDKSGENSRLNKLSWADVDKIRSSSETNSVLAEKYKVARSRISDIRTMKSWKVKNG